MPLAPQGHSCSAQVTGGTTGLGLLDTSPRWWPLLGLLSPLTIHPFILYPSVHLSTHPSIHPSIHLSPILLSVYPPIQLSIHLSTHPSIHSPVFSNSSPTSARESCWSAPIWAGCPFLRTPLATCKAWPHFQPWWTFPRGPENDGVAFPAVGHGGFRQEP